MKNFKNLFFLLLVVSTSAYSQIEVSGNGKSKIGNPRANNDYSNEVSLEVLGLSTAEYRPGARISIGDYGSAANGSNNLSISEAWGWDSDQLQVHGKNGIIFTLGGGNNYIGAELYSNGNFNIAGQYYSRGSLFSSDIRLKT